MKTITPAEPLYRVAWVRRDDPRKTVHYGDPRPLNVTQAWADYQTRNDPEAVYSVVEADVPYGDPDFLSLRGFNRLT